jgi:hypothetical protein
MGEPDSTVDLIDKMWSCHKHNRNYIHKHPHSTNPADLTYEWPRNWYCPVCNRIEKWLLFTFIGLLCSIPLGLFSSIIAGIVGNPVVVIPALVVSTDIDWM